MIEILHFNLQMCYDFQIFCSISITPRRHRIFQILPSKVGTVNKIERLQKQWPVPSISVKEQEILYEIQRFVV